MASPPTKSAAPTRTPKTRTKNSGKPGKEKPINLLTSSPPHSRLLRRSVWEASCLESFSTTSGRVAPGSYLPRAPTDPDLRNYRIRLVRKHIRYRMGRMIARGSGKIRSRRFIQAQSGFARDLRQSHLNQTRVTRNLSAWTARWFPVTAK
jgi:hypothetical protein